MKGEIIRRMSMEIIQDGGIDLDNPFKIDKEKVKTDDEDDYLVKTIGAFGLWQAVVSFTVSLTRIIALWNMMSLTFLTPVVEFVCVEFDHNVTTEVKNSTCYDSCVKYNYSSVIGRSIIEDFELICQKAWLANIAQFVLMMGVLIGSSLFGWISDRFGRRTALIQSTFLNAVLMIALPFSPSYIVFVSIRFAIGIATGGSLLICIVQIMEIIGKRHIEVAGVCSLIPDGLAQASLAGFAYFTSNWQGYTMSYGVAACFIFVLILFVPESPRWLMANGKVDDAIKVITGAASRNNLNTSDIKDEITKAVEDIKLKNSQDVKPTYLDFIKSKTLFISILIIFIIWFALCVCFYGIYQYVTIVGFDPYLTVVMLGLIQIPFLPIGIILNKKFGRKNSTIGTTTCIAIAMLTLIFIQKGHWLVTVLGVMAFIFSNISFSISYVHVSELYPTPLRNMSYGLASVGAKLGSMCAPFVVGLLPIWLPSLIFCICALVAGLCCLALPETKGRNLKDSIEN